MRCPSCGDLEDKVLDSRSARDGAAIRRRRECQSCHHRYTTFEEVVKDELRVVKHDGRHETLNRHKLIRGVTRACEKRPVSVAQIEALVDSVLDEVQRYYDREIQSMEIGEKVIARLEKLDDVAYVRFASVYKRFADVSQFANAIRELKKSGNS